MINLSFIRDAEIERRLLTATGQQREALLELRMERGVPAILAKARPDSILHSLVARYLSKPERIDLLKRELWPSHWAVRPRDADGNRIPREGSRARQIYDLMKCEYTPSEIANVAKVSPAYVKREIARLKT